MEKEDKSKLSQTIGISEDGSAAKRALDEALMALHRQKTMWISKDIVLYSFERDQK